MLTFPPDDVAVTEIDRLLAVLNEAVEKLDPHVAYRTLNLIEDQAGRVFANALRNHLFEEYGILTFDVAGL